MDTQIKLKIIRDLAKLRDANPAKMSKALSHIILGDFNAYLKLMEALESYDSVSGGEKTSVGYNPLDPSITEDLLDSIVSYCTEETHE